ncbi:hypothetical protein ACN27G_09765 [Plantactinospora sp. WMMB334]|uniref:hypothetical protein n=1 Tax=Plantactinospora sp. WMMB334 TaxID=3404119 RepID=UPI003B94BBEF
MNTSQPRVGAPRPLADEAVIRLVRIAVERLGVSEVRFTAGLDRVDVSLDTREPTSLRPVRPMSAIGG